MAKHLFTSEVVMDVIPNKARDEYFHVVLDEIQTIRN